MRKRKKEMKWILKKFTFNQIWKVFMISWIKDLVLEKKIKGILIKGENKERW